jgi:hypothetical protein
MGQDSLRVEGLSVGRLYRIIYRNPLDKLPRQMIAKYMGQEDSADTLFFNLRPIAGTQAIKIEWIQQLWETDQIVAAPTIYRGETRVF